VGITYDDCVIARKQLPCSPKARMLNAATKCDRTSRCLAAMLSSYLRESLSGGAHFKVRDCISHSEDQGSADLSSSSALCRNKTAILPVPDPAQRIEGEGAGPISGVL
jgi:hypothetical protein